MALYKYPGHETGQAWTMKPGNLEGEFWGRYMGMLGPSVSLLVSPGLLLKMSRFHYPTLACLLDTLDIRLFINIQVLEGARGGQKQL